MNDELKNILDWYKENGVLDFVNEEPVNHFALNKDKATESTQQLKANRKNIIMNNPENIKSRNMDEIVKLLALKHNNKKSNKQDVTENILTPEQAIQIATDICEKINSLEELKKEIEQFEGCYSLKKLATNTVFGEGGGNAKILIIGDAPNNDEDLQGRPFCGQSGILLDKMFKAIGYNREHLFITNSLFWRPPGNRTPTPEEVAMCKPFIEKKIALVNPKIIITMGNIASRSLLNINDSIMKIRGKFFDYKNPYLENQIKTIALFHPSFLIKRPIKKRDTWKDLLTIKEFLLS